MSLFNLAVEVERLRTAIREHRDTRGDDRCWQDDETLYKTLPEGYEPPRRDASVELDLCRQYIACRRNPATEYVSPQRRIEELEKFISQYLPNGEVKLDDLLAILKVVESTEERMAQPRIERLARQLVDVKGPQETIGLARFIRLFRNPVIGQDWSVFACPMHRLSLLKPPMGSMEIAGREGEIYRCGGELTCDYCRGKVSS